MQKTILITGASGFIGKHLIDYCLSHQYFVIAYSRKLRKSNSPALKWISSLAEIENEKINYVVNLAGESIGQGRWTQRRKQQLIQSRVTTTQLLYQALTAFQIYPECIVSGSAIGFYGIDPTEQWANDCDEHAASQDIFMSEMCQLWEKEALSYLMQNTKIIRLGVVFGQGGGILPQILLPIKMNLVGKIGSGKQPMTWVHITDVIRTIEFLFENNSSQKIFNVVAPDRINQLQFVQRAAAALHRKPLFALPSFILKWLMGEQAQLVLNGQFVQPRSLLDAGFSISVFNT